MSLRVLNGFACSGTLREEFRALGCDAWTCDLKPAEDGSPFHIAGDFFEALHARGPWDVVIAHPPCTFLSGSGIHWNNRGRGWKGTDEALKLVALFMEQATAHARIGWVMENPVGIISTRIRKPDQIVQPYRFGDDASKATCLWLHGLKPLREFPMEQWAAPRWVCRECGRGSTNEQALNWKDQDGRTRCHLCEGTPRLAARWANQTDSGQNRLGPSEARAANRARNYPGIAAAMAAQWSAFLLKHQP